MCTDTLYSSRRAKHVVLAVAVAGQHGTAMVSI